MLIEASKVNKVIFDLNGCTFPGTVEPAPGADLESLEVVKDCLHEVFKLNTSSVDEHTEVGSLVEYFSSFDANKRDELDLGHATTHVDPPSTSSTWDAKDANPSQAPKPLDEDLGGESSALGVSKDELFGRFFASLDKVHFFKTTINGEEDHTQVEKATRLFHEAVQEMERSGCKTMDSANLAETFKSHGNSAMQGKFYSDAIELYTYSIALCEKNAVYYCNRAAAYTQIQNYMEAIRDCYISSEIDPNYSKAYSRLGLAYYAQGNYRDALEKGFYKALRLDPNSDSIKENIRVATQKLHAERDQSAPGSTGTNNQQPSGGQTAAGGSRNHSGSAGFSTSIPFNPDEFSTGFTNIFRSMAANMQQDQERPPHADSSSNTGWSDEPGITFNGANGADINMNFGENVPEDLMGTWRSVMGMFSGAQPHQGAQHRQQQNSHADTHGEGSPPN
ncbi:hypothetical protein GIB67_004597 [Kingdonia uniflora]|uniref:Small glutamine-rich tetratricopeptide repeat-containing protein n=1 Tax=Kingdonia uniflora TaxID=39325 RepID=A0A7J7MDE1_9MAGN|nr:hypothetical protein GIB67_004597 [Kingdonia uniflora]